MIYSSILVVLVTAEAAQTALYSKTATGNALLVESIAAAEGSGLHLSFSFVNAR